MEEFEFESTSEATTELVPRTEPELLLPTDFSTQVATLRTQIAGVLHNAEPFTTAKITTIEERDKGIEAGRLLQVMSRNVAEFYKPIKQKIDGLKQPILDMEHADADRLKAAKDLLGTAIQDYEAREAAAEALRLAKAQQAAAQNSKKGELPLPANVPAVVPKKTHGRVSRTSWYAEVTDLAALVQAVASGKVPMQALLANQDFLDKRADSDREGMTIPGVIARKKDKVHFRA